MSTDCLHQVISHTLGGSDQQRRRHVGHKLEPREQLDAPVDARGQLVHGVFARPPPNKRDMYTRARLSQHARTDCRRGGPGRRGGRTTKVVVERPGRRVWRAA
jgi:hypothetical protein